MLTIIQSRTYDAGAREEFVDHNHTANRGHIGASNLMGIVVLMKRSNNAISMETFERMIDGFWD